MRGHECPVSTSVLDREHKVHGSCVLRSQRVPLHGCAAQRILEIDDTPLQLHVDDLLWTKEDHVRGTSERIADGKLECWPQRWMCLADDALRHSQLTGVAERRLLGRVCLHADAHAHPEADCADGVEVGSGVTVQDPEDRRGSELGPTRDLIDGQSKASPARFQINAHPGGKLP